MFKISQYFDDSGSVISSLKKFEEKINLITDEIIKCNNNKNKILVAGNGGSCSDCEHFVGELQCTFKSRSRNAFSAISLPSLPSALTAWSNDFGFESYFKRQVDAHGKTDDILFLISTGGGNLDNGASMSLVKAAEEAKKRKLKIISILGKGGGILKNLSDISIIVESKITSHIQEAHIAILHCICENLEAK